LTHKLPYRILRTEKVLHRLIKKDREENYAARN